MFDTKEAIKQATDKIWIVARSLSRGETLTYDAMVAAGGIEFTNPSFKTVAEKIKRRLQKERSIAVRADPKIGYRLLTNQEQVERGSQDRQRRAYRQLRRGIREVSSVDNSELSDHYIGLKVASQRAMADTRRTLGRSLRSMASTGLIKTPAKMPRVKIG